MPAPRRFQFAVHRETSGGGRTEQEAACFQVRIVGKAEIRQRARRTNTGSSCRSDPPEKWGTSDTQIFMAAIGLGESDMQRALAACSSRMIQHKACRARKICHVPRYDHLSRLPTFSRVQRCGSNVRMKASFSKVESRQTASWISCLQMPHRRSLIPRTQNGRMERMSTRPLARSTRR